MTRALPVLLLVLSLGAALPASTPAARSLAQVQTGAGETPAPGPTAQGTLDLLFDQGRRQFDAFEYADAITLFDRLIETLTAGGTPTRPELLVQCYELRARARYALGNTSGAEEDFSALLAVDPSFRLAPTISPRVVEVFDDVRRLTVGQLLLSMTPAGEVAIDGRPLAADADPRAIDLAVGDHEVRFARPGFREISQTIRIVADDVLPLALVAERVSATLAVVTIPAGVEVLLNGASRGVTEASEAGGETSAPLILDDLPSGTHRLLLRRACYVDQERSIDVTPADLATGPLRMVAALATARVQTAASDATIFVDGDSRGTAPAEFTVCEGSHLIEVRGATGRFVDRRTWRTGDTVTLNAELRSAFPVVLAAGTPAVAASQLATNLEQALAPARRIMIYAPADDDLQAAIAEATPPADWLRPAPQGASAVPRDVMRTVGERMAARLGVQGVSGVFAGTDPYDVSVVLLAAGSGVPDVVRVNLADPASQTRALERLGATMPPLERVSLETTFVDVAGVPGAIVVRAGGVGARAGLTEGDAIVSAADAPVASVADLRAALAAEVGSGGPIPFQVRGPSGATRTVNATPILRPDVLPLGSSTLLYNRLLLDLENAVRTANSAETRLAAHLNLAIVQMRLSNWADAQAELEAVELPEGDGVSRGTVDYLRALCLEATGRRTEAVVAFQRAAADTGARLSNDGPLVSPLARLRLAGQQ